jgi:hypothetical protein
MEELADPHLKTMEVGSMDRQTYLEELEKLWEKNCLQAFQKRWNILWAKFP